MGSGGLDLGQNNRLFLNAALQFLHATGAIIRHPDGKIGKGTEFVSNWSYNGEYFWKPSITSPELLVLHAAAYEKAWLADLSNNQSGVNAISFSNHAIKNATLRLQSLGLVNLVKEMPFNGIRSLFRAKLTDFAQEVVLPWTAHAVGSIMPRSDYENIRKLLVTKRQL